MDMFNYILFWICIIGLCLGSFYNVVILRSLSNESIVFPASKCPKCGHKLYFWHNIPVLSYILLGGKCYFCKEKISLQYPIIEIITMSVFVLIFLKFGISWNTLFFLCWVSCLIIMTATDIKEQVVDCNIAIIMALLGFVYNYINGNIQGLIYSIVGCIAGFIILEVIARLGYLFVKSRAMGEADSYVAGAIGAIFTIQGLLPVLLYSLFASMIFIVPMFLYNRLRTKDILSFITFIVFILSAIIYKFYNQSNLVLILLLVFGVLTSYNVIKQMKNHEKINYLPFVPALAAGIMYGFYLM